MTKLIVHAPTVAALARARRNVANLLKADPEATVELVVNGAAVGEAIDVGLYAEDVILCREPPSATSARNALPARIVATDRIGHEVLITLRIGDATVRVRVTPGAARELMLAAGQPVFALIKTTACHHLS